MVGAFFYAVGCNPVPGHQQAKEKEAMKASLSFPIPTHNQGDWALVKFALLLEMLSIRQSVQNGHFQDLASQRATYPTKYGASACDQTPTSTIPRTGWLSKK
jgi:hypothetical protein